MFYVLVAVSWYVYRCTVLCFPFYTHPESNVVMNNFAMYQYPKGEGDEEGLGLVYT